MQVKLFLEELVANGWKQKEIAAKCGFKHPHINRIINGHEVKIQTVEKIAKAFDKPLSFFLDDEKPEKVLTRTEEKILQLIEGDKELANEILRHAEKEKLYRETMKQKAA